MSADNASKSIDRKLLIQICGLLSIPLIICVLPFCAVVGVIVVPDTVYRLETRIRQRPFESTIWKSVKWQGIQRGENRTRDYMLSDLLAQYDFTGWKRDDVVKLLGEPDEIHQNFHRKHLSSNYYRIDGIYDAFIIDYDQYGIVVDSVIRRDT